MPTGPRRARPRALSESEASRGESSDDDDADEEDDDEVVDGSADALWRPPGPAPPKLILSSR